MLEDIIFYGKKYMVAATDLATANDKIITYLTSSIPGNELTVDFNGVIYSIDRQKLDIAKNKFITYLETFPTGANKVIVNNTTFNVGNLDHTIDDIITILTEKSGEDGISIKAILGQGILGAMLLGVGNNENEAMLGQATLGLIRLGVLGVGKE